MVARLAGVKGVAGGELHCGGGFGSDWGYELRWFPIVFGRLGGSAGSRGVEWWRWMGGGGPGCDAWRWGVAAAEPPEVGEDGFPLMITGCGGFEGMA